MCCLFVVESVLLWCTLDAFLQYLEIREYLSNSFNSFSMHMFLGDATRRSLTNKTRQ